MKKTFFLSCIITLLVLSGCSQSDKQLEKEKIPEATNTGIAIVSQKKTINVH